MVAREADYSLWGWIMLAIIGMTPKPRRIQFICTLCRTELASSRAPRDLAGLPERIEPPAP